MAIIIDLPMARMTKPTAPRVISVPRCQQSLASGLQCRMPAIEHNQRCSRHATWFELVPSVMGMPYPEDAVSLQDVMARTIDLLVSSRITADVGSVIEKLCRAMQKNLYQYKQELDDAERQYWELLEDLQVSQGLKPAGTDNLLGKLTSATEAAPPTRPAKGE